MVPSGTRRLKATTQEVSVNDDGEEKSRVLYEVGKLAT
jgi:hypothetical protein